MYFITEIDTNRVELSEDVRTKEPGKRNNLAVGKNTCENSSISLPSYDWFDYLPQLWAVEAKARKECDDHFPDEAEIRWVYTTCYLHG